MTRRLAALAAALVLSVGVVACSDDPTADEIDSPGQEQQEQTVPGGDGPQGERDPGNDIEGDADGTAPIEESGDSGG